MKPEAEFLKAYVALLIENGALQSESVRRAFLQVRRHRFIHRWCELSMPNGVPSWSLVSPDLANPSLRELEHVYSDCSLVTAVQGQVPVGSLSQPSLVASMLETLSPSPGMRILEIGTCSGYNAALLSELVSRTGMVVTIENRPEAAAAAKDAMAAEGYENVNVLCGDGFFGASQHAPFDRVIATVGCSDISPHWLEQIRGNGSMLIPLQHGQMEYLVSLVPDEAQSLSASGSVVGRAGFMPIEGALAWANPWRCLLLSKEADSEYWRKPLPSCLPEPAQSSPPWMDCRHADFHFFLSLISRELWQTQRAYGFSDMGTGAKLEIRADGVVASGPSNQLAKNAAVRLYEQLQASVHQWEELGAPELDLYKISFAPKSKFHSSSDAFPDALWIVERVHFMELVSL